MGFIKCTAPPPVAGSIWERCGGRRIGGDFPLFALARTAGAIGKHASWMIQRVMRNRPPTRTLIIKLLEHRPVLYWMIREDFSEVLRASPCSPSPPIA